MNQYHIFPIGELQESPNNPRRRFDEKRLQELVDNIKANGVMVPLIVRSVNGHKEILAGARRYRAAKAAGLKELPANVLEVNDDQALEIMIFENDQREDVHPLDQAMGYKKLLQRPGYDMAALRAKISRSETFVYRRMKLLDLIKPAQDKFLADDISLGHAELIARLQPGDQKNALDRCFRDHWNGTKHERVLGGVKELDSWIQSNIMLDLHAAPFSKTADDLGVTTPCVMCPKRTGYAPALFPDIARKDTCTDPSCYKMKLQAHIARKQAEFKETGEHALQLSANYGPTAADKKLGKLIYRNSWTEVKKKDRCEHAQKGIVLSGTDSMGHVLEVCADPKCKKHHGSGYSSQASPEEKARRKDEKLQKQKDQAICDRIIAETLARIPTATGIDRADCELMAEVLLDGRNDTLKPICERNKWPLKKHEWGSVDYSGTAINNLVHLSDAEIYRLIIELCLLPGQYVSDQEIRRINSTAARYGVDAKAIEKAVCFEFDKKTKPSKAETKPGKGKPKPNKSKTKRAKT
jgi:ParB family transcriptional regulator, chromosome partitioning protein